MIAGVATGMADAFGIDVVVMRVIWVVVALASFGIGIAAYAICWLAFPSDEHPAPLSEIKFERDSWRLQNAGFIVGLALLGIGLVIVFGEVLPPFRHGGDVAWAIVLIGAGLAVLFLRHNHYDHDHYDAPADAARFDAASHGTTSSDTTSSDTAPNDTRPDDTTAEPDAPSTGTGDAGTSDTDPVDRDAPAAAAAPGWVPPTLPTPPIPPSAWTQSAPWPLAPTLRVRRRRPRPFLTPLTLSVLLIGGGIALLLDNNGSVHLTAAEILAGALCVIGIALMLSTWLGRARGLVPLGILVLLVTMPAAAIDVPLTGGTGDRVYAPTTRSDMRSKYELGIGRLEISLLEAPLVGHASHVRAELGIGQMVLDVPSTVRVIVHAHTGAGSITLFGSSDDGGLSTEKSRTAPGSRRGLLDLDLRVGAGHIEVHRFDPTGVQADLPGSTA
jgi:phage shock protein PspC (stress-responsive transcriptional regulator)